MARRYYHLPGLTGLNTFDACARHSSFTGAAGENQVSAPGCNYLSRDAGRPLSKPAELIKEWLVAISVKHAEA